MGRRGPKPEPAAIKEAKGNPSRRKVGSDPAVDNTTNTAIKPPAWLKGDALRVWKRLAPRIAAMKLLTQTDAETFGRYCRNMARWLKLQKRLDDVGEFYEVETASGTVRRADPAFMLSDRLDRLLSSAEANFGLNPAERQRIFAARAAGAGVGDLFGSQRPPADKQDTSASHTPATKSPPRGFLN